MSNKDEQSGKINEIAGILKILSEPNRLRILEKIMEGIQCNCDLGSALQIAPNLISHHLSVLRSAGLIVTERDPMDARWIYYTLNDKKLDELRVFISEFFDPDRIMPRRMTCGPSLVQKQSTGLPN